MVNLHLNIQRARVENSRYRAPPKGSSGLPSGKTKGQLIRAARIDAGRVNKQDFKNYHIFKGVFSYSKKKRDASKRSYASIMKRFKALKSEVEIPDFNIPVVSVPRGPGDVHFYSLGTIASYCRRFVFHQMYVAALSNFTHYKIPPSVRRERRRESFKVAALRNKRSDSNFLVGVEENPGEVFARLICWLSALLVELKLAHKQILADKLSVWSAFQLGFTVVFVHIMGGSSIFPYVEYYANDVFLGSEEVLHILPDQPHIMRYNCLDSDAIFFEVALEQETQAEFDEFMFAAERYFRACENQLQVLCMMRPAQLPSGMIPRFEIAIKSIRYRLQRAKQLFEARTAHAVLMMYLMHDIETNPGEVYKSPFSKPACDYQKDIEWCLNFTARNKQRKLVNIAALRLQKFVDAIAPILDKNIPRRIDYEGWIPTHILDSLQWKMGPHFLPPAPCDIAGWEEPFVLPEKLFTRWNDMPDLVEESDNDSCSTCEEPLQTEMMSVPIGLTPATLEVVNRAIGSDGRIHIKHDFSDLMSILPDLGEYGNKFKKFLIENKEIALLLTSALLAAWAIHSVSSPFTKALIALVEVGVVLYLTDVMMSDAVRKLIELAKYHFTTPDPEKEVFETQMNDAHVLKSEISDVIGIALCGGLLSYSGYKSVDGKDPTTFFRALGSIKSAKEGTTTVIDWILQITQTFAKWLGGEKTIEGFPIFQDKFPEFKKLQADVEAYCTKMREDPTFNYANSQKAYAIDRRISELYNGLPNVSDPTVAGYKRDLFYMSQKLKPLLNCFSSENLNAGSRKKPGSLWIGGDTQVGKSSSLKRLATDIFELRATDEQWELYKSRPGDAIYAYAFENSFWDAYHNQPIVIMDEAGVLRSVAGVANDGYMALIRMINIFDFPLDMADLPKKGKTNFDSEIVITTSNQYCLGEHNMKSIGFCKAVSGRFAMAVHQGVKREYATEATKDFALFGSNGQSRVLDKSKLPLSRGKPLFMEFCEYQEIVLATGEPIGDPMDYPTFLRVWNERLEKEAHFSEVAIESYAIDVKMADERRRERKMNDREAAKRAAHEAGLGEWVEARRAAVAAKRAAVTPPPIVIGGMEWSEDGMIMDADVAPLTTEMGGVKDWINGWIGSAVKSTVASELRATAQRMDPQHAEVGGAVLNRLRSMMVLKRALPVSELSIEIRDTICEVNGWEPGEFNEWCDEVGLIIPVGVIHYEWVVKEYSKYLTPTFQGFVNAVTEWWNMQTGLVQLGIIVAGVAAIAALVTGVALLCAPKPVRFESESGSTKTKTEKRKAQRTILKRMTRQERIEAKHMTSLETEAMVLSDGMTNSMVKVSKSNHYVIEYTTDAPGNVRTWFLQTGFLTFVGGQVGMMNHHMFDVFEELWDEHPDLEVRLKPTDGTNNVINCRWVDWRGSKDKNPPNFAEPEGGKKDVLFFRHPGVNRSFASISKRFISSLDPMYGTNIKAVANKYAHDSKSFSAKPASLIFKDIVHVENEHKVNYDVHGGYRAAVGGGKGMCGTLYWMTDSGRSDTTMIVGVHTSGGDGAAGISCITREMVEEVMAYFNHPDNVQYVEDEEAPLLTESSFPVLPELGEQFTPIAVVNPLYNVSKCNIVPSELHGKWAEPTTKPARTTGITIDGKYQDALKMSRDKINKNTKSMNFQLWDDCVASYANLVRTQSVEGHYGNRLVPWEEAIAGKAGVWQGVPVSTSAGYMYDVKTRPDGKKFFVGGPEGYDLTKEEAVKFLLRCKAFVAKMEKMVRPCFIFKDCVKVETLPWEKVDAGKVRQINASPFDLFVICRRYFGAFVVYFMQNKLLNGSALGVNPFGDDWDLLARELKAFAGIIAGDYSGWDASITVPMMRSICKLIRDFYADAPVEDNNVREMLFLDLFNSKHVATVAVFERPNVCVPSDISQDFIVISEEGLDEVYSVENLPFKPLGPDKYKCVTIDGKQTFFITVVYEWKGGMPSGHFLTTVGNIIVNNCVVRYAVADCVLVNGAMGYGIDVPSPLPYIEANMYVCCFGDDNLIGISEDLARFVSQEKLTFCMARIGLKYTDESKSAAVHKLRTLEEVSFLKRGFRYERALGRWLGDLEDKVIDDMCMWRKLNSPDDSFKQTCRKAVAEKSQKGRVPFVNWWARVRPFMLAAGVAPPEDSWESALKFAVSLKEVHC